MADAGARAPIARPGPAALARRADVADPARDDAAASRAENTIRAYRRCRADVTAWCAGHGLDALPAAPSTGALCLARLGGERKASTIRQRVSAIAQAHKTAGQASPTQDQAVRLVLAGIRRTHGTAQEGEAAAVTAELRRMVDARPAGAIGVRDRALLLVGFAGAVRRSELVALDVGDVQETTDGLVVAVRRSKTGLDPARYAGRSLRAGPATSAAATDVPEHAIARQTGHKSLAVPHRCIRTGSLVRGNAAARVGLGRRPHSRGPSRAPAPRRVFDRGAPAPWRRGPARRTGSSGMTVALVVSRPSTSSASGMRRIASSVTRRR